MQTPCAQEGWPTDALQCVPLLDHRLCYSGCGEGLPRGLARTYV